MPEKLNIRGFDIYRGFLNQSAQMDVLADIRNVVRAAPMLRHMTPYGKQMSVAMSAAGDFGWVSDARGYRYARHHPNGQPWPSIPQSVQDIWNDVAGSNRTPQCCLINHYREEARMGMHQDRDEADLNQPVVSISLGDDGLFRIGNLDRGGKTDSIWLNSGDVVVMGGAARLTYHGVDRIRFGSSKLLAQGGRLNLTLRVVD